MWNRMVDCSDAFNKIKTVLFHRVPADFLSFSIFEKLRTSLFTSSLSYFRKIFDTYFDHNMYVNIVTCCFILVCCFYIYVFLMLQIWWINVVCFYGTYFKYDRNFLYSLYSKNIFKISLKHMFKRLRKKRTYWFIKFF